MGCRHDLLSEGGRLIHSSLEKYVFHGSTEVSQLALKPLAGLYLP